MVNVTVVLLSVRSMLYKSFLLKRDYCRERFFPMDVKVIWMKIMVFTEFTKVGQGHNLFLRQRQSCATDTTVKSQCQ